MHQDVRELSAFYDGTRLGNFASTVLARLVGEAWPDLDSMTVVGFGYPLPLMADLASRAYRSVALMPGPQGVIAWPKGEKNVSVLADEGNWPLHDATADRILVLHGLETSEQPDGLLSECWRVLVSQGRVLFVVPNRSGLWSSNDNTPFGHGRPFTGAQLESLLESHRFEVVGNRSALFGPPSDRRFWTRSASAWERIGRKANLVLGGGVLLVEATKTTVSPIRSPLSETVRRRLRDLEGIAVPAPKPVTGRSRDPSPKPG